MKEIRGRKYRLLEPEATIILGKRDTNVRRIGNYLGSRIYTVQNNVKLRQASKYGIYRNMERLTVKPFQNLTSRLFNPRRD